MGTWDFFANFFPWSAESGEACVGGGSCSPVVGSISVHFQEVFVAFATFKVFKKF